MFIHPVRDHFQSNVCQLKQTAKNMSISIQHYCCWKLRLSFAPDNESGQAVWLQPTVTEYSFSIDVGEHILDLKIKV